MSGSDLAKLSLSGTNTLRLTQGGTVSKEERQVSLDYLLFVPAATVAAITLETAATVSGPYAAAAGATVNAAAKTITVPVGGSASFYRLRSSGASSIKGIAIVGGNVVISYN